MTARRVVLVVASLLAAGCKPSWPRYVAPDGTFTAELPAPLRSGPERDEGSQRLLTLESRGTDTQGFLVQRRRPAPGRRLDPDAVLQNFCADFAQARGYRVLSDVRGTRADGRTAQACAFESGSLQIRLQLVAGGQCVYTLMAMWSGPPPDADRFFDAFRVTKDCPDA